MSLWPARIALLLVMQSASAANADVSAEDACMFFVGEPELAPFGDEVSFQPLIGLQFVDAGTKLERYRTLVAEDVMQTFGALTREGFQVRGTISAQVSCLVDVIDRRVIYISVQGGRSVGKMIEADTGRRTVREAKSVVIDVGGKSHWGKY